MAEQTALQSRVIKTEAIKWKELDFIQQENFKEWIDEGDDKLQQSLLKYQFADPFKVWQSGNKLYCLDGKHRYLDLLKLEENGVDVPEKLPATFMRCQNKNEAAELVLAYSSQYAKVTQQGLFDFVSEFDIDIEKAQDSINISEFSMKRFEQKFDILGTEDTDEPHVDTDKLDPIVQEGDIFQINGHKIVCGSFKDDHVSTDLMKGEKARIVNCDPPYNLPTGFFLKENKSNHEDFKMASGEMSHDEFVKFLSIVMQKSVENTINGAIHYIFMDFRHSWHITEAARLIYNNPEPKQVCVWHKDMIANGSFYRAQHELCFLFANDRAKALWNKDIIDQGGKMYKDNNEWCFIFKSGDAKHLSHLELKDKIRTNVWKYPSASSMANPDRLELKNHPTPKPVKMIADAILDTTNEGDLVIDWFLGSGTCLIACENTKRKGRFTDIDPVYIQSSLIRYLNYCDRKGIDVNFTHVNGELTLKNLRDEQRKLSDTN